MHIPNSGQNDRNRECPLLGGFTVYYAYLLSADDYGQKRIETDFYPTTKCVQHINPIIII